MRIRRNFAFLFTLVTLITMGVSQDIKFTSQASFVIADRIGAIRSEYLRKEDEQLSSTMKSAEKDFTEPAQVPEPAPPTWNDVMAAIGPVQNIRTLRISGEHISHQPIEYMDGVTGKKFSEIDRPRPFTVSFEIPSSAKTKERWGCREETYAQTMAMGFSRDNLSDECRASFLFLNQIFEGYRADGARPTYKGKTADSKLLKFEYEKNYWPPPGARTPESSQNNQVTWEVDPQTLLPRYLTYCGEFQRDIAGCFRKTFSDYREVNGYHLSFIQQDMKYFPKKTVKPPYQLSENQFVLDAENHFDRVLVNVPLTGYINGVAPPQDPLKVGGGVSAPKPVYTVDPEFTDQARGAKLQGTVVVHVIVGPDGRAHYIRVVQHLGMGLDEKALEAIRQWKFQPAMKDGQAVAVAVNIEVTFRLE